MSSQEPHPALPPGLEPLAPGDPAYIGRYRVAGRLGAGGMGAVYAAVDEHDRCLAVKVVHREYAADPVFRARFTREVELVRRVAAFCTARFVAADAAADRPWLATEYVPGPTLRARIREHGTLSGGMLVGLAAGVAEALHAIHAAGIVHRDLKPGNLILAPDGPKVLDFGIARAVDESGITHTGGLVGSPGWVAPERYEGADATPLSDVFAWGGLVALAATGRNPFGTGQADMIAYRTLRESPDTDGVPEELLPLVRRALSRDPADRPETGELLRALAALSESTAVESAADEEPTQLVTRLLRNEWRETSGPRHDPASWASLAPPRRRRRRTPVLAAGAAVAVLAAGGGAVLWSAGPPWSQAAPEPDGADGGSGGGQQGQSAGADGAAGEGAAGAGAAAEPSESEVPEWMEGEESLTAEAPGIFLSEAEGRTVYEVTLDGVEPTGTGLEFSGTARYSGGSGQLMLNTDTFYVPDRSAVAELAPDAGDVPESARTYPASSGEIAALSPDSPEQEFAFTIPGIADPGAIVFDAGGDRHNPHLCYRTDRIYERTETNFLNNHWRAWDMCTDGDDDYD